MYKMEYKIQSAEVNWGHELSQNYVNYLVQTSTHQLSVKLEY